MNNKTIIKWTNRIALLAIILLIYWIFIYTSITVFSLKIFKENITEFFYLSILGIIAILIGAVIVNIMFNLTSISESLTKSEHHNFNSKRKKLSIGLLILSFPLIFGVLFYGDYRTTLIREKKLIKAAKYSIVNNEETTENFLDYSFSEQYIRKTAEGLEFIAKQAESFPSISIIIKDTIHEKDVFLRFTRYYNKNKSYSKIDYIYACSPEEQEYLKSVFDDNKNRHLFSASDGNYELYYPYQKGNKVIILYFTDRKQYGKYGS
ncbi:hypothetical protein GM661_07695 [Iocasia frigidifontis]|uniref:Uncharacterized protein n=1 Tax=Iocasia fonsfrigidae TaxID=2682810 RepID=A0A8A7KJ15_9FIRM|nr:MULTISPECIES: hypothetical protein [Halanaerobiaceae]AZO94944.1 hypothetical protein D7D81_10270 [Halocella sp. SP3-1]QTL97872.1 hypothetical protein GM661_07695 [Iocasia fonsfrigidae]